MPPKQQLKPVPFTQVQLHDAFWAPRMAANRNATLPAEYAQLERSGRLAALELAWQCGAGTPPHIFWDSDIAKWIEAASFALAAQFDAQDYQPRVWPSSGSGISSVLKSASWNN